MGFIGSRVQKVHRVSGSGFVGFRVWGPGLFGLLKVR